MFWDYADIHSVTYKSENDNIFIYRPNIPPIKAINKTMAGNDICL
jgi:hypothetical protein